MTEWLSFHFFTADNILCACLTKYSVCMSNKISKKISRLTNMAQNITQVHLERVTSSLAGRQHSQPDQLITYCLSFVCVRRRHRFTGSKLHAVSTWLFTQHRLGGVPPDPFRKVFRVRRHLSLFEVLFSRNLTVLNLNVWIIFSFWAFSGCF